MNTNLISDKAKRLTVAHADTSFDCGHHRGSHAIGDWTGWPEKFAASQNAKADLEEYIAELETVVRGFSAACELGYGNLKALRAKANAMLPRKTEGL